MGNLVMCVDDSKSMRLIIKKTLEKNFNLIEAENGRDALGKLNDLESSGGLSVSLFLVDVNMPVMDGFEFVKELRTDEKYNTVPILMLTSESSDRKKLTGKELGVSGWVVKPFDPGSLIKVIKALSVG
ncbi:MAG: response regulator [Spirochaetes bacterium]|nr:response regulator [Spirochaetota bacterium]